MVFKLALDSFAAKNANTDLPPLGFNILFLLGSKYAGFLDKVNGSSAFASVSCIRGIVFSEL